MRTSNRLLLCSLFVIVLCTGNTILPGSGIVRLDNGVYDPTSRGFGRGIGVDLESSNFSFYGGDGDSVRQYPGSISGGLAMPAPWVSIDAAYYDGPVTVVLNGIRFNCDCGGTLHFTSGGLPVDNPFVPPGFDPPPNVTFIRTLDLASIPVSMTGTLYLPGEQISVYGSGTASMRAGFGRLTYGGDTTSWIWGTKYSFTFAEVPEPATIGQFAAGMAAIASFRLLRSRYHT